MKIEDIVSDFGNMSDAELEELIKSTRTRRVTSKAVTVTKRPTKEKEQTKERAIAALENLGEEQLKLIQSLLGGKK